MAVEKRQYKIVLWLILLAAGLSSITPFLWIIAGSLKPHLEIQSGRVWPWQEYAVKPPTPPAPAASEPASAPATTSAPATAPDETPRRYVTLDNYRQIFGELSGLPVYYFNTAYLALSGTFLTLLVGSLAAYGFARFRFVGNKTLFALLLLTIMIPGEVMLIGQYELMFQLRLFDKIAGLLLAYVAGHLLLVIFIMRNVFTAVPQEIVDAAMIDGAGTWGVFWDVMVPIGRNGLAACGILTFLGIWNEFVLAMTFTSMDKVRTLPVGIVMLRGQYGMFESGVLFATVLLSFIPIVLVFILLQKYFVRGLSAGAIKA